MPWPVHWKRRPPGPRLKGLLVVFALAMFAFLFGLAGLGTADLVVNEPSASLGRWLAGMAFAAVLLAAAGWYIKILIELLATVCGREWGLVLDKGAVTGAVRTTFGWVTSADIAHARIERSVEVCGLDSRALGSAGLERVRAATQVEALRDESTFGWVGMLAGVVSLGLVEAYRVEQRSWSKEALFSPIRRVSPFPMLLVARTEVAAEGAPAAEAAFVAALEALRAVDSERVRVPFAEVMAQLRIAPTGSDMPVVAQPYRSANANPFELAQAMDAFYTELGASDLRVGALPNGLISWLELALKRAA